MNQAICRQYTGGGEGVHIWFIKIGILFDLEGIVCRSVWHCLFGWDSICDTLNITLYLIIKVDCLTDLSCMIQIGFECETQSE